MFVERIETWLGEMDHVMVTRLCDGPLSLQSLNMLGGVIIMWE